MFWMNRLYPQIVMNEHKHWQDSENLSRSSESAVMFFICAAYNSKSVLQMACQEKDTESLKSLQTELWWAFKSDNFHHVMGTEWHLYYFSILIFHIDYVFVFCFSLLRPFLTAEQNHLLHLVVQERITPSGQGI